MHAPPASSLSDSYRITYPIFCEDKMFVGWSGIHAMLDASPSFTKHYTTPHIAMEHTSALRQIYSITLVLIYKYEVSRVGSFGFRI